MITDGWMHALAAIMHGQPGLVVAHGPGWAASPGAVSLDQVGDQVGRADVTLTAVISDGELLIGWDGVASVDIDGAPLVSGWVLAGRGYDDASSTVICAASNPGATSDPFPVELLGHAVKVRR